MVEWSGVELSIVESSRVELCFFKYDSILSSKYISILS